MESLTCNVKDIESPDRQTLERMLGRTLQENQQLVIQVFNLDVHTDEGRTEASKNGAGSAVLPDWCDVYAGLSDKDIAELEQTILQRANLSRPSE